MKKRILSALLALCMVFALGTVGAMATDEPVMEPGTTGRTLYVSEDGVDSNAVTDATTDFKWLGTAINNARSGDTIIVQYSFTAGNNNVTPGNDPTGIYNINKDLTIKGEGNVTITAGGSNITRDIHLFNITSGEVTIENITIAGANTASGHPIKHGIHVYNNADVTLKNVTVNNCYGYGLVVNNGGSVEADGFTASGNAWGGVNVDAKSRQASLTMTDSTVTGNGSEKDISVVLDSAENGKNTVELVGGTYNKVMTNTKDTEKNLERSVGDSDVTISGSKIDNLSLNGTGTDKVQIKDNATVGTISGSNADENSSVSVTDSTVTSTPANTLGFDLTYVNATVGDKTGVTSEGVVATIGGQGYPTLKAALEAANEAEGGEPVVIELIAEANFYQAQITLTKDITIKGKGADTVVSVQAQSGASDTRAFTLSGSTLTLDNVHMNIEGIGNQAGDYDSTAFEIKANSELAITNDSKVTIETISKGIVFMNTTTSKVTLNNATLEIKNVDGNASNGGIWTVTNSNITVNECGDHALSTEKFTATGNSVIKVSNANKYALYGWGIDLEGSTKVEITDCGTGLTEPNAPVQLKTVAGNKSYMTIGDGASVSVTGTNNKIVIPNEADYTCTGTVTGDVVLAKAAEGENAQYYIVTYKDGDTVIKTEKVAVDKNDYKLDSALNGSDGWTVEGDTAGTVYSGGAPYTFSADVTFVAHRTTVQTYDINVSTPSNGTVTVSTTKAAAGETVSIDINPAANYAIGSVTVTGTTATRESEGHYTFKMPAQAVTVTVTFTATTTPPTPGGDDDDEPDTPTTYSVTPQYNAYGKLRINGYSAGSVASVAPGTAVTVTVSPTTGYRVDSVTYRYNNANYSTTQTGTYTFSFIMPAGNISVSANIVPSNAYPLNISSVSHGSIKLYDEDDDRIYDEDLVPYGETVTIEVTPAEGYILKSITVEDSDRDDIEVEKVRENVYRFDMPRDEVTLYTEFTPGYEITIDDDIRYGEIATDPEDYAAEDDTVEVYFKPSNGYKLKTIEVFTGKDFDDEVTVRLHSSGDYYRFTMPDGDVYITAEFERTTMPFTDVRTTDWYYDEVLYVYNNGLMEGVSSYSFNPSGTMTREMFWAVLGRIDGQSITGTNWASQARSWAMNEGVSDGTNPTSLITREEMVTMLWRYAGSRAASGGLSRFNDASTISSWASTAMSWAVNNGIIDGVTSNTIQPRGTADRAQCAAIFMRYDQM